MLEDHRLSFGVRPAGVSSRLHPGTGPTTSWHADNGARVDLPVVLDLVEIEEATGRVRWWVVATIGAPRGTPVVVHMSIGAEEGLDVIRLQREFRWQTPVDVVTRIVPRLLQRGEDPFRHEYPITGYPEASLLKATQGRQLSDEFLEDIAREYLQL